MATLIPTAIGFNFDTAAKAYELHQLCTWGADTTCNGICNCAVMIRVTFTNTHAEAYLLEPGITFDQFDAAEELISNTPHGYLVLSPEEFRHALTQC